MGEAFEASYDKNNMTLNSGRMDSLLDFNMNNMAMSFVKGNISTVEKYMISRNNKISNTATMANFLSSHDEDGMLFKLKKKYDENTACNLMKIAATFQITAKGQTVIYYGEEIGLTGENNYPYQTNRYDFDWSLVNDSNSMYMHYKKLLNIRKDYSKIFAKGLRNVCVSSDAEGCEVISREYNGEKVFVGLNIKNDSKNVSFATDYKDGTKLYDIYNGAIYTVGKSGTVSITLPSADNGGTVILSTEDKKNVCSEDSQDGNSGINNNAQDGSMTDTTIGSDKNIQNQVAVKTGDDTECIIFMAVLLISAVVVLSINKKYLKGDF